MSSLKSAAVGGVVGAFVAAGTLAFASTMPFTLGTTNRVDAKTAVTNLQANGTTVNPVDAPLMTFENKNTTANATPLALIAGAGRPPMTVNSSGKVTNLNADQLDGLDSSRFLRSKPPVQLSGSVASPGATLSVTNSGTGDALWLNGRLGCNGCVSSGDLAADGPWHYIGDPGEPGFENGWVNYDAHTSHTSAIYQHAAYYRDKDGIVHLGGLIKSGAFGTAFSLYGAALCPYYYRIFSVMSAGVLGRITVSYVDGTGTCHIQVDGGTQTWVSLDGVQYRAQAYGDASAPPPLRPDHPAPLPSAG